VGPRRHARTPYSYLTENWYRNPRQGALTNSRIPFGVLCSTLSLTSVALASSSPTSSVPRSTPIAECVVASTLPELKHSVGPAPRTLLVVALTFKTCRKEMRIDTHYYSYQHQEDH
jgi:hypothetical protein